MFLRLDQGAVPPDKVDEFARFMTAEVVPQLRKLPGYLSTLVAVDRTNGRVAVTMDWESADARARSDEVLAVVLRNAGRLELTPERILLYERAAADFA